VAQPVGTLHDKALNRKERKESGEGRKEELSRPRRDIGKNHFIRGRGPVWRKPEF